MDKEISSCINIKLQSYFEQLKGQQAGAVYKMVMQETEYNLIKFMLNFTKHNKSETARILGISRATLNKKIKLHNL